MRKRNQNHCFVFVFLSILYSLFSIFCSLTFADKITLKDGKCYEGKLIGKSEKRYLFSADFDGVAVQMSFFPEEVEKVEWGKDSVDEQIPYLKEVDSLKVEVQEDQSKVYEVSLYTKTPGEVGQIPFADKELKKALDENEFEYYQRFTEILKRYSDKFSVIERTYTNLTSATKEEFIAIQQYMDELYFELNNLYVPEIFQESHRLYLQSVTATFAAFNALELRKLDEATKQIKMAEETRIKSLTGFRAVIESRRPKIEEARPEPAPQPIAEAAAGIPEAPVQNENTNP